MIQKMTRRFYRVVLVVFILGLLPSALPSVLKLPYAVEHFTGRLLMPEYLLAFTGVTKLLGMIALLIPGYPRVKEWVFAGFTFDFIGAIYASLSVGDITAASIITIYLLVLAGLYFLYYKTQQASLTVQTI